ncbi:4-aminobutyrate aminotransferase_ mitochondrial, partial [Caligus rogercresseyi]
LLRIFINWSIGLPWVIMPLLIPFIHKVSSYEYEIPPQQIYPMMCGTCSNENALKIAFMKYMDKQRG